MDLDKMIAHKLHYYKQLQKQIDAHRTKAASAHLRKQWLERQKVMNYTNEYDRIRGIIAQSVVKHGPNTVEQLQKRAKKLEDLGAKAIDEIV
jgi:UDP-N-acetylglucosamine pyrophosphorylase